VTAIISFIPLSLATIHMVGSEPSVGLGDHLVALGFAILLHVLIVASVLVRLRSLNPVAPSL
jgi:hypothetical protein